MRLSLLVLVILLFGCNRRDPSLPTTGTVPRIGEHESFLFRHEAFLAEARAQQFDVICLGDSLTWGWDDHRELWKKEVTSQPTAFWAIGGDATNQLLWRIEHGELDGQHPKLIVLLIGTNNRWMKDDADDIAKSIDTVMHTIQQKCPTSKLLLLGILPQGYGANESSRKRFAEVNLKLPALATARGAEFHDLGSVCLEPDGSLSTAVSYDGTHLTELGYQRFAKALGPIVRELVK
jgi:lysophospholipase L1-like esterase